MRHIIFLLILSACLDFSKGRFTDAHAPAHGHEVLAGAYAMHTYLPLIKNKRVGLLINARSKVNGVLLLDTLLRLGVKVTCVFVPEHGFRAQADAGEIIDDEQDALTKVPIWSLYGKNKQPTALQLSQLDVLVFDLQDVGVRFYTYISTLHYAMEVCAQHRKTLIVLDRPNPNRHYVDGPVLRESFKSFVGMHPIPVVYGLTIGELAKMIQGEQWISRATELDMIVVSCLHYYPQNIVALSEPPSPSLRTHRAVLLYPSLCFFEGTCVSVGRGTSHPFECYGHPLFSDKSFRFIPKSMPGAKNPVLKDTLCFGEDLSILDIREIFSRKRIELGYLLDAMAYFDDKNDFFTNASHFDKLAGTDSLRKALLAGQSEDKIRSAWQKDLERYLEIRKKYLMYPVLDTK